mmetsp:Transcript_42388/g.46007  ORF Transcript_42388/g.46007 Transcript_42388/m.46007 type:complete len:88 (+) Transcript_42388:561-824(+)
MDRHQERVFRAASRGGSSFEDTNITTLQVWSVSDSKTSTNIDKIPAVEHSFDFIPWNKLFDCHGTHADTTVRIIIISEVINTYRKPI